MDTRTKSMLLSVTINFILAAALLIVCQCYDDAKKSYDESIAKIQQDFITSVQQLRDDYEAKLLEQEEKPKQEFKYRSVPAPMYSSLPISEEIQQYTYDTCVVYGIEDHYELVLAVMWRESNFNAEAISSTNDYGIMQINQCNHEHLKSTLDFVDIMDVHNNIEAGIYLLSGLFDTYEDESKVLMAYNMGPGGAAEQWSRGNYTSSYSRDVLSKAELISNNKYEK